MINIIQFNDNKVWGKKYYFIFGRNVYNPLIQGWVINCKSDIALFSCCAFLCVCVCVLWHACMMDGALCAAATKWRSRVSGGCRSSRVPRSRWLLGRASREELEPHTRYWNTPVSDGNLVWSVKDRKPGVFQNSHRVLLLVIHLIQKSLRILVNRHQNIRYCNTCRVF